MDINITETLLFSTKEYFVEFFDINSDNIKDRIVVRNNLAFAFPTILPIVPGHILVCPIRAVQSCENLTKDEWDAILALKSIVCAALIKAFEVESFNFAWNNGENAGQTVPHFHLHIVPRKKGDTGILKYDPRVFLYRPGSRAVSPEQEILEISALLRSHL